MPFGDINFSPVSVIQWFKKTTGDVTYALKGRRINSTLTSIQGTAITGTTGSGNVMLSASPTATGNMSAQTIINNNDVFNINTVTVSSNAGTCSASYRINNFINSSAATMAITLSTSGATDGQLMQVRVIDFSAVVQTIGWTNTTNSSVSAPLLSNGSTTLPLAVLFQYSSLGSSWVCVAVA